MGGKPVSEERVKEKAGARGEVDEEGEDSGGGAGERPVRVRAGDAETSARTVAGTAVQDTVGRAAGGVEAKGTA